MTKYVLLTAAVLSAAPAPKPVKPVPIIVESPSARTIHYSDKDVAQLNTRVGFQTMIVLPKEEQILDVLSGDSENWKHQKAVNFAFVSPIFPDKTTNLILITASGNPYIFVLTESSKQAPDLKVFVELRSESMRTAIASKPQFVPAVAVDDFKIQAQRAREQAAQVEADAAKRIADTEKKAQKELLMAKAAMPQQMKFEYHYEPQPDFNVVAIWHDDKFTYIAANPVDVPAIYEIADGKASLINFQYTEGLYTIQKIVSRGYLAIGKRKMHFTRIPK